MKMPNIAPRGPFLTSPLAPRGEICPIGGMFTHLFTPEGEQSLLFRRMEGRTDNFTPRGHNSPLWAKFSPRGEVKNGPLRITSALGDKIHPRGSKFAPRDEVKNGPLFFTEGGETYISATSFLAFGVKQLTLQSVRPSSLHKAIENRPKLALRSML
jgi:hypothetical protein